MNNPDHVLMTPVEAQRMKPSLFDNIERNRLDGARYTESQFQYLNESARPLFAELRRVIDVWYSRYPGTDAASLRGRFRSKSDDSYHGAYFELFLHELLTRLASDVEIEPELPTKSSKRPDFKVYADGGNFAYLEARLAKQPPELDIPRFELEALSEIDHLDSPLFVLKVAVHGSLTRPVPLSRLRSACQTWIDGLDYESSLANKHDWNLLPLFEWKFDEWVISARALPMDTTPRDRTRGGTIGIGPTRGGTIAPERYIRGAIRQKAGRYGELGAPFIVAVNCKMGGLDDEDVANALFGNVGITFQRGPNGIVGPVSTTRTGPAAWVTSQGPINTRVSAALVFDAVSSWGVARASYRLWVNPWAAHVVPEIFDIFPRALPVGDKIKYIDGASLGSLLGLPDGWPESIADD